MNRKLLYSLIVTVLTLTLTSMAGAQGPDGPPDPLRERSMAMPRGRPLQHTVAMGGPTTTASSWSDTLDDDIGFTQMEDAAAVSGDVVLSQIEPLGYAAQGGSILAMVVGPDGKVYLGTSGAYLNVYDPATGNITGLGAPVPDECFG